MEEPRVVRRENQEVHSFHGEGRIRRIIYPDTVGSQNLFIGEARVEPGAAPHVFHRHGTEISGNLEITYAPHFEEFYYIVEGSGSMQWKTEDGMLYEQPVSQGDAIYMPPDTMEHRIFNNSKALLRILYGGTPPAKIVRK
jgi:uncharacterized cupin superfamily protein